MQRFHKLELRSFDLEIVEGGRHQHGISQSWTDVSYSSIFLPDVGVLNTVLQCLTVSRPPGTVPN